MSSLAPALALSLALAWQPAPPPPGGYWQLGEQTEPEPPDGDETLTIGSVLFSLGILRAGVGGVSVVMGQRPDLCPASDPEGCRGIAVYGWTGVGFGALMVVTGAVYLGIGANQRARHRRWQQGLARVGVAPWWVASPRRVASPRWVASPSPASAGIGVQVRLRF